ncbi:hypothetical protein MC7420_6483 [Coleofasciculus chthonoplastes PCC 7420]|uniref:Uncharacterized protein n=1 Tax=Coleofasciculus chthonoplastes PCC 7420 TaxID=118168 RepID=B4VQI6_9CYAN|nr:hypothetical protein MC7420_6483 [Coleofasciculus chthonoplastes PCC 7420]
MVVMMSSTLNSRKRNSRLGLEVSQRLASIFNHYQRRQLFRRRRFIFENLCTTSLPLARGGLGRGKIKVLQSFELRLGWIRMG